MTADFFDLAHDLVRKPHTLFGIMRHPFEASFLGRAATRIINEVRGINRVT
jgi:hypothetical protein